MFLQPETNILSLAEELDFEDEGNISITEEESTLMKGSNIETKECKQSQCSKSGEKKDVGEIFDLEDGILSNCHPKKKEIQIPLLEELSFGVSNVMSVNLKESSKIKGNKIDVDESGELQPTEMGEMENDEKLNNLEEGEISDDDDEDTNDNVCRYFKKGTCFYESHCPFLHISDKVYNMFDPVASHKRNMNAIVPCFFPPQFENPVLMQNKESSWEKGLKTAKALIQKSIFKRIDDEEFEIKKLYGSSDSFPSYFPRKKSPILKTNLESKLNISHNVKPLKSDFVRLACGQTIKGKEKIIPSNCLDVEKYKCDDKWVDPWMRSKSPRKRKRCELYSSSSSSSMEGIYQGSEKNDKLYKKRSPTSQLKGKRFSSRSCSRSLSRSKSRSCSRKRCRCHLSSVSKSSLAPSRCCKIRKQSSSKTSVARQASKKRRSTSLERWFKHEHRNAAIPRSSSPSNMSSSHISKRNISPKCNSDNESWSSMTVSSISCSYTSSSSESPKSPSNQSKMKKQFLTGVNALPSRNGEDSFNLLPGKDKPLNIKCVKEEPLSPSRTCISAPKERESISASHQGMTSEKISKSLAESSSCAITKNVASKAMISSKPVLKLHTKPSPSKESANDNFTSTLNCLLRYRSLNNRSVLNQPTVLKPVTTTADSAPSAKSMNTSHIPVKKTFSRAVRPTITLNLQPKSQKYLKPPEVTQKKQDQPGTVYKLEKKILSKRETLMKQLKLVEDAIARKKRN